MRDFWSNTYYLFLISLSSVAMLVDLPAFHKAEAAQKSDDVSAEKTETELHLGLTENGFNRLLQRWQKSSAGSKRIDHYFDVFRNGRFLVRREEPRAKLRIQNRPDELVIQKSWINQQRMFSAGGFQWSAAERTSANVKFSRKSLTKERCDRSLMFLQNKTQQQDINAEEISQIQQVWHSQTWPKLDSFDSATADLQGPLMPAAIVLKERWQIPVQTVSGQTFKLQLGRDSDVLGQGKPTSFELEIELKDASTEDADEAAELIGSFLQNEGLQAKETSALKGYDFFQRLENLYSTARN
ncbi:MAG: hypothetical protein RI953_3040 [Pseudomonadota bacterium]|jgi:hypothetical protein